MLVKLSPIYINIFNNKVKFFSKNSFINMSLGNHYDANITTLGRNPKTSHWFVIDEMFKIEELRYRHCHNL